MSVAEAEPAAQRLIEPVSLEQVLLAGRYVVRCRRACDTRSVLVLLGDILSPADAIRFATALEAEFGANGMLAFEQRFRP